MSRLNTLANKLTKLNGGGLKLSGAKRILNLVAAEMVRTPSLIGVLYEAGHATNAGAQLKRKRVRRGTAA